MAVTLQRTLWGINGNAAHHAPAWRYGDHFVDVNKMVDPSRSGVAIRDAGASIPAFPFMPQRVRRSRYEGLPFWLFKWLGRLINDGHHDYPKPIAQPNCADNNRQRLYFIDGYVTHY